MGSHESRFSPNVRERHSRAVYIALPIALDAVPSDIVPPPPLELDVFDGMAWICIVVDDLDQLASYVRGSFFVTPMVGWMMKLNVMVKCPVGDGGSYVRGYQIRTLDFEACLSGGIKTWGARATQRIPSNQARFEMSFGASGTSATSPLDAGVAFACCVTQSARCPPLLQCAGTLAALPDERRALVEFIVARPTKFLLQIDGSGKSLGLFFSPELGEGACVPSADGCVEVHLAGALAAPMVSERLPGFVSTATDAAFVFVQPEYNLVDHHNTPLEARHIARLAEVVPVVAPGGAGGGTGRAAFAEE
jgi:hypothetical protein